MYSMASQNENLETKKEHAYLISKASFGCGIQLFTLLDELFARNNKNKSRPGLFYAREFRVW